MEKYKNLGRNSGIHSYEIGYDYIIIKFNDRWKYLYNYHKTGVSNIEKMKELALNGRGLNSFINRVVNKKYARKFR